MPNESRPLRIDMVNMPLNVNAWPRDVRNRSGSPMSLHLDAAKIVHRMSRWTNAAGDTHWTMMTLRIAVAWSLMRSKMTEA